MKSHAVLNRSHKLACVLALLGTATATVEAQSPEAAMAANLPGFYRLTGVRETAFELLLRPDGRYEAGLAYGGADGSAAGRWKAVAGVVELVADTPQAPSFALGSMSNELLGNYGNDPSKPTLLVVRVSSPKLGLTWSNIQVQAEFSNGEMRQGMTSNQGMLGFLKRTDGNWSDATIRRVGVSYPKGDVGPTWFPIDSPNIKGVQVHFEPGSLITPAFQRVTLATAPDGAMQALEITGGDLGTPGWRLLKVDGVESGRKNKATK
jgi:hypothetical protein